MKKRDQYIGYDKKKMSEEQYIASQIEAAEKFLKHRDPWDEIKVEKPKV